MPSPFPRPALPGTVPASHLSAIEALHSTCRRWSESVPIHLPYVDLAFAFGFATLGDATRSQRLLASAWEVMQFPVAPPIKENKDYDPAVASSFPPLAYRAFASRTERAVAGRPLAGPLSADLLVEVEQIRRDARTDKPNKQLRLLYVFDRLREQSRILDPECLTNPYAAWMKHLDPVARERAELAAQELAELAAGREPDGLATRMRRLALEPASGQETIKETVDVLRRILPLAPRVSAAFAADMLDLVPPLLADSISGQEYSQGRLLRRALFVAAEIGRGDIARGLSELFAELARRGPEEFRLWFVAVVGTQCLRSLRWLGLRDDIHRVFARVGDVIPASPQASEPAAGILLGSRLVVAAAWLTVGSDELGVPILDESRAALLGPDALRLDPADYTKLACAYVTAIGQGPAENGLPRVAELFDEMPQGRVKNSFTTAPYFSRMHLNLTEEVVAAIGRMLLEPRP